MNTMVDIVGWAGKTWIGVTIGPVYTRVPIEDAKRLLVQLRHALQVVDEMEEQSDEVREMIQEVASLSGLRDE